MSTAWERRDAPLGTLIYRAGLLSEEKLQRALAASVRSGRRLGEVLVQWGWLDEDDLGRLLARQRGLEFLSLRETEVDPAAARLLPAETVRRFRALPVTFDDETVVVAIDDPIDELAMELVRNALERETRFVVVTTSELRAAIDEWSVADEAEGALDFEAPVEPEADVEAGDWDDLGVPAGSVAVVVRLATGEHFELSSYADEDAARLHAEDLIAELGNGAGWPFLSGRYVNPAAIVSIDVRTA